jgi:hypothetical protein
MGPLEIFVMSMCLNGLECNQTLNAYYLSNPELKYTLKNVEKQGREMLGPYGDEIITLTTPFIMLKTGQPIKLKMSKHVSLRMTEKMPYGIEISF